MISQLMCRSANICCLSSPFLFIYFFLHSHRSCVADVLKDALSLSIFQTLKSGDNNKDLLGWKVSFIRLPRLQIILMRNDPLVQFFLTCLMLHLMESCVTQINRLSSAFNRAEIFMH